ncbi:MAG: hypothetical protein V4592_16440 [Bacteroidota bacterium]
MYTIKNILKAITAIVLLSITFTSCKKDSSTGTTTVAGSASANVVIGSAAAVPFTASTATFINASGVVDIVATGSAGSKLTLHLTGVTAAGTFNLTSGNTGVFINGGVTYTTVGSGGGNVIITTLSADKVEGTFLVESFAGTVYCGISGGKFTAGK